jgi:hypothetical protein
MPFQDLFIQRLTMLRQFQDQIGGRKIFFLQNITHILHELFLCKLPPGDIDTHLEIP